MENKISVGIIDDHSLVAKAIAGMINAIPNMAVLQTYKHGRELKEYLENGGVHPTILLMDINMPIMNGFETTTWLQKEFRQIPVLVLTMNADEVSIIKMFRCGAKGYLLKDAGEDELQCAIESVLQKGFYYSDFVAPILMSGFNKPITKTTTDVRGHTFKDREIDFLKLVCTELTYKEIAEKMFLSPKTIDGYRETLFQKLNIKSRVGLALFAIKNRIYEP